MNVSRIPASEWLGTELFGATVVDWVVATGVWVAVTLALVLVVRVVRRRAARLAERTANRIDDFLAEVVGKTTTWFLIAVALYLAIRVAAPAEPILKFVDRVVFIVFLLQVIRWGSSLISMSVAQFERDRLETDAGAVTSVRAIGFLSRIVLWVVVVLLALDNFGINITALVAGLGIGGIAVALAVQNILGDLFASLSIVLDKPFVIGDFLIVDNYLGTVEHIGLKTTRIRSLSGEQIVVSNSDLLKSRIRNYKRMYERRVVFELGVVYDTPLDRVRQIPGTIRAIVESKDNTRFDRAHFKAYGDFSLKFEVVYYVLAPDYALYMDIQQAINLEIGEAFEREGIRFAYPTSTVFVHSAGPGGVAEGAVRDDPATA